MYRTYVLKQRANGWATPAAVDRVKGCDACPTSYSKECYYYYLYFTTVFIIGVTSFIVGVVRLLFFFNVCTSSVAFVGR